MFTFGLVYGLLLTASPAKATGEVENDCSHRVALIGVHDASGWRLLDCGDTASGVDFYSAKSGPTCVYNARTGSLILCRSINQRTFVPLNVRVVPQPTGT